MLAFLKEFYRDDITNLLNDDNDCLHVSLHVNLSHLKRIRPELYAEIRRNVWSAIPKWNRALLEAQKELIEGNCFLDEHFQIKENCHVRFINLPQYHRNLKGFFPNNRNVKQFVKIKGSVVRMTQARLLEFKRDYRCTRCKETFTIEAQYRKKYVLNPPRKCLKPNGLCKGNLHPQSKIPKSENCMDYQEIRIQEPLSDKYMPASMIVTLDNDLVGYCQPGDCVTICGTVENRWPATTPGKSYEVELCLRAVSVLKDEEKINYGKDLSEQMVWVRAQWQDTIENMGLAQVRDTIIRSICPEIHGMYLVKLAVALAICGGVRCSLAGGTTRRGNSHLLLVGDPGLAKSKLLREAFNISVSSVHTTGMGSSAAGLTAAAIKDEGEWMLEAGALVLADGGVCCIDEFNLMSENDKASIHEAMEQQTLSVAKAGLVCKLNTRCGVIAAMNPKNLQKIMDGEELNQSNIGIGTPLLSRFDLILILRDERHTELDNRISNHILQHINDDTIISTDIWDLERLQSHFLAVQGISPVLTREAHLILDAYYNQSRSDSIRDSSRSTVRLLESLHRLAQAHARLLFRDKVDAVDAIMVIRLMEASWGFGRLLSSVDVLREDLPLGPNEEQVREVTSRLNLESLNSVIMENLKEFNMSKRESRNTLTETQENSPIIGNLQDIFGFKKDNVKRLTTAERSSPEESKPSVIASTSDGVRNETILNELCSSFRLSENHSRSKWSAMMRNATPNFRKNSLFNSSVLDDALNMDIFDSLEMTDETPNWELAKDNREKPSTSKKTAVINSLNISKSPDQSERTAEKTLPKPSTSGFEKNNSNPSTSNDSSAVASKKSLFDSDILDDSLDMDLFKSLEAIESPKTSNVTGPANIMTERRDEKLQEYRAPFKLIKSKSLTFQRFNPLDLNDQDLEDADLDIDLDFTPKTTTSLNQETENRPLAANVPLPETTSISRKSPNQKARRSHEINESSSFNSSPKPDASKRMRLAPQTLEKLNKFINPKLIETEESPVRNTNEMLAVNKTTQNETEDSAYDTMPIKTTPNRFARQNGSRFTASLDDDLDCLDFDI